MKVSVAMCTYNGAKYIQEQLDSILHQTRPVDEIIISDDGSSDDTLDILRKYEERHPCIYVSLNEKNKGYKQNFMDTMRQCTGDIVFLSDQDDRWHLNKVELILDWFDKHPKMQLVFTNANIIDGSGKQSGENIFDRIGFDKEKQRAAIHGFMMDILWMNNRATGATMAIRKGFINEFQDEWGSNHKFHDYALVLEAFGREVGGFISTPIMDYRIHGANQTGICPAHHVFESPYKHKMIEFEGMDRWANRVKERITFSRERFVTQYSLFGAKACWYIPKYLRMYGSLWYKAYTMDMKEAWEHSMNRIKHILLRKIGKINLEK